MLIAGYVNSLKMHQYILAHPKHRGLLEAWGAFPPQSGLRISGFIALQHRWLRGPR